MSTVRYQALGPLLSGEGSRAFLGLMLPERGPAQPVVLIWVPPDVAKDPELAGNLARETLRAAILEHPNIIRVYGLAALDEGLARIVDFADGETLRKTLETTGKLPPRLAGKIAADAAMGVHFAHLAGNDDGTPLLHGDLRPETVMVSFGGAVKVAGYGALSVAPREAGGNRVVHRRRYCAPEQLMGGRTAITVQTDVFLLGLVLYECLTGKMPFQDAADFDQALLTMPLPLEDPDIPLELRPVIERATAKRATDRFPGTRELREAIERAVGSIATNEELAAHLEGFFPSADPIRLERRRLIDAGVAEWARKQWERDAERARQAGAPPPPLPGAASSAQAAASLGDAQASAAGSVGAQLAQTAVGDGHVPGTSSGTDQAASLAAGAGQGAETLSPQLTITSPAGGAASSSPDAYGAASVSPVPAGATPSPGSDAASVARAGAAGGPASFSTPSASGSAGAAITPAAPASAHNSVAAGPIMPSASDTAAQARPSMPSLADTAAHAGAPMPSHAGAVASTRPPMSPQAGPAAHVRAPMPPRADTGEVSLVVPPPRPKRSPWPLMAGGSVAIAVGVFFLLRAVVPAPAPSPAASAPVAAAAPVTTAPPAVATATPQGTAPAATPAASATPPAAPTAPAPKSEVATASDEAPAKPKVRQAAYTRPAAPRLELIVDPPVSARLDGKSIGRTPVTVATRPGRHTVWLTDRARGVNLRRVVDVDRSGTTTERITLGRASFSINVPDGAEVYLDGKRIANRSVKDYGILEGTHVVRVMLGTAKWEQSFDVAANEHMDYDVTRTAN